LVDICQCLFIVLFFYIKNRAPKWFLIALLFNFVHDKLKLIPFLQMRISFQGIMISFVADMNHTILTQLLVFLNKLFIRNLTEAFKFLVRSYLLWLLDIGLICFFIFSNFLIPLSLALYVKSFSNFKQAKSIFRFT